MDLNYFYFLGHEVKEGAWLGFATASVAGALGALVGAGAAFWLEWLRRSRDQRHRDLLAGNLALFTLNRVWNVVHAYEERSLRRKFTQPNSPGTNPPLWLRVSMTTPPTPSGKIDWDKLSFLFDKRDGRLLGDLSVVTETFEKLIGQIGIRADHLRQAQRLLETYTKENGAHPKTDEELIVAIGRDNTVAIQTLTVAIVTDSYEILKKVPPLQGALATALISRFDATRVMMYQYPSMEDELKMPIDEWVAGFLAEVRSRPPRRPD